MVYKDFFYFYNASFPLIWNSGCLIFIKFLKSYQKIRWQFLHVTWSLQKLICKFKISLKKSQIPNKDQFSVASQNLWKVIALIQLRGRKGRKEKRGFVWTPDIYVVNAFVRSKTLLLWCWYWHLFMELSSLEGLPITSSHMVTRSKWELI